MEQLKSVEPVDTCQEAGSQPYPSGWIRILIMLFGPRSFLSPGVPSVALNKLPTSASLKWRRRDYTRFFIYTDGSSNWIDFLLMSPPSGILFVAFSVRSLKHAPCCGCPDWEQLPRQTCLQGQWNNGGGIFLYNRFARTVEQCGSLQHGSQSGLVLALTILPN